MLSPRTAAAVVALGTLLAGNPAVQAETMLEWAKARGASAAEKFEDDVTSTIERPRPIFTRTRTWGTAGPEISELRATSGRGHTRAVAASLAIDYALSDQSYEPAAFTWGRTWLLSGSLGAGAGGDGGLARAEVEAGIGPFWGLSRGGEGLFTRLSLRLSETVTRRTEALGYGVSLPLGFTSAWAEFGLRPELGSLELVDSASGGPLLLGAYARTFGPSWLVAVEHDRTLGGDVLHSTRVSACGRIAAWSLCSDGWWVATARAQWGWAGMRVGIAWGRDQIVRTEAPTNPVRAGY
jgi:hypothetical protein